MKPIMLAFRPDTTDIPHLFSHAVIPMYIDSDFLAIQNILYNELKGFQNVCAIDDDNQANRLELIVIAEKIGFDSIELDEQLHRDSLTVEEFNELKAKTILPIGVTSVADPMINFIRNGARPSFLCVVCYDFMPNLDYVKREAGNIPVYGAVNFADPSKESAKPQNLNEWSKTIWNKVNGIWFWGWHTGNPEFEPTTQQNYPIVKELVQEFHRPKHDYMLVFVPALFIFGKRLYDFLRDVFKEEEG